MADTADVKWETCGAKGCIGFKPEHAEGCIAHDEQHRDVALRRLRHYGHIDARGVTIDAELFRQIITTASRRKDGPLLQDPKFERTTFAGDVRFERMRFRGRSNFSGATFKGTARFRGATFKGEALFNQATFEREAWFRRPLQSDTESEAEALEDILGGVPPKNPELLFDRSALIASLSLGQGSFEAVRGTTFERGAGFRAAIFKGPAWFDGVSFMWWTGFDGAKFEREAWFLGATFKSRISFEGTTFQREAGFLGATLEAASFGHVVFEGDVGFGGAMFMGSADFGGATFRRDVGLGRATFRGSANFGGSTFEQSRELGPILGHGQLVLDDVTFNRRVQILTSAHALSCMRTRFTAGVQLRLRWTKVTLDDADLAAPAILAGVPPFRFFDESALVGTWAHRPDGPPRPPGQPWLASMRRADVAGLAIANVDLQACQFAGAHNLDLLGLESQEAFTATPGVKAGAVWPPVWWWTRRQTLAEEHAWHATHERGIRRVGWHANQTWQATTSRRPQLVRALPVHTRRPMLVGNRQQQAREVANLYRSLRKAREDAKDEPGAADFYYGEMEFRRHAAARLSVERAILTAYWLVAGYALRAWRAFLTMSIVLVLAAWLLAHRHGFAQPQAITFWSALRYSGRTAIGLLPKDQPTLTPWGDVVQIAVRILVPVLLGLGILSVRGRVKR